MNGWVKSSFCGGGGCVEVRFLPSGHVGIRDSNNPHAPALIFTLEEWATFLAGVFNHEFDLPGGAA